MPRKDLAQALDSHLLLNICKGALQYMKSDDIVKQDITQEFEFRKKKREQRFRNKKKDKKKFNHSDNNQSDDKSDDDEYWDNEDK